MWGLQTLASHLARKRVLLILDNMEQVVAAGPALADLLAHAPRLRLLVTSREALRVRAEQCVQVPPLAVPHAAARTEAAEARRHGAVELFAERAAAVWPGFELGDDAATVAEICARLDGLPLAIELAAARTAVLAPEAILARLDQRFGLLAGGPADLPERHKALRTTIGWSYDLLDAGERALFERLAVFAGGFDLDAAEVVCDGASTSSARSSTRASFAPRAGASTCSSRSASSRSSSSAARRGRGPSAPCRLVRAPRARTPSRRAGGARRSSRRAGARARQLPGRARLAARPRPDRPRATGLGARLAVARRRPVRRGSRAPAARARASQLDDPALVARLHAAAGELEAHGANSPAAVPLLERAVALWRELGDDQEAVFALQDLGWAHFFSGEGRRRTTA